jgi:hypothetical protein
VKAVPKAIAAYVVETSNVLILGKEFSGTLLLKHIAFLIAFPAPFHPAGCFETDQLNEISAVGEETRISTIVCHVMMLMFVI